MAQKQEKAAAGQKPEKAATSEVPVKRAERAVPVRAPRRLWPVSPWEREIDRLFEDFHQLFRFPRLWGRQRWPFAEMEIGMPAVDVYEKGDDVVVKAEIPGMSKDDIEVNLTDTTLTITGEKRKEEEVKQQDYYSCERSFGSFSRTIDLPAAVNSEQAKATFKDGILEVRLPKTEEAKRKAIKVEVK
jgi:HSP20 family protein